MLEDSNDTGKMRKVIYIHILSCEMLHINQHNITVDPHLSEHLGTEGWSDMRNVQITETGLNAL